MGVFNVRNRAQNNCQFYYITAEDIDYSTRDILFFLHGETAPSGASPSRYWGFTITLRHTTLGRTTVDKWSTRRTDIHLTAHNTHRRKISTPAAAFEPAIPVRQRPQTCELRRAATGIGIWRNYRIKYGLWRWGLSLFWVHLGWEYVGWGTGWVDGCAARSVRRQVDWWVG